MLRAYGLLEQHFNDRFKAKTREILRHMLFHWNKKLQGTHDIAASLDSDFNTFFEAETKHLSEVTRTIVLDYFSKLSI